jgi:hypothetical protein
LSVAFVVRPRPLSPLPIADVIRHHQSVTLTAGASMSPLSLPGPPVIVATPPAVEQRAIAVVAAAAAAVGDDAGVRLRVILFRPSPQSRALTVGGPAQVFPPKRFFWGGRPLFPKRKKHSKNRQTPNKERPFFSTKMRIAPPHCRDFRIDLQRPWTINRRIGDRQGMSNCFRHALTIAVLLFFFVAAVLGRNNIK